MPKTTDSGTTQLPEEDKAPAPSATNMPGIFLDGDELTLGETFSLPDAVSRSTANGIEIESQKGPRGRSSNTPPVAGLEYVILNEDSLKNGRITTDTQIAWLWSFNGQDFTYDPDGDAITNIMIGGISNSDILGTLDGNIGFVTQFSTAAQYTMTYQVEDARGALSNVVSINLEIEPVGSNNRPVCQISSVTKAYVDEGFLVNWANSTDDAGDTIDSVRILIVKPDGRTTEVDGNSNHLVDLKADQATLKLFATGVHKIRVSVMDNYGAWSNWFQFSVQVLGNTITFERVNIGTTEQTMADYHYFIDGALALELLPEYDGEPQLLYERLATKTRPTNVPLIRDVDISGYVKRSDGTPYANETVSWSIPQRTQLPVGGWVTTDSTGYFSVNLTVAEYWNLVGDPVKVTPYNLLCRGDVLASNQTYTMSNGKGDMTNYYHTSVQLSCGNASYKENVVAGIGSGNGLFMANKYVWSKPENGERFWDGLI